MADQTADQSPATAPLSDALAIRGYLTIIPFARSAENLLVANGTGITVADAINAARADLNRLAALNGGFTAPPEGQDLLSVAHVCPLIDGYDQWHWTGTEGVLRKIAEDGTIREEAPLTVTLSFFFDPRDDLDKPVQIRRIAA